MAKKVTTETVKTEPKPEIVRSLKPWIIECFIDDPQVLMHNAFMKNKATHKWFQDEWMGTYVSVIQALKTLNTKAQAIQGAEVIGDHWRYAGKEFRLFNTDTKEAIRLLVGKTTITLLEIAA